MDKQRSCKVLVIAAVAADPMGNFQFSAVCAFGKCRGFQLPYIRTSFIFARFVIPDGQLDLAELAGADILLELPTSMVCDEGCKGLCPECGANLNEGDCGCRPSAGDPRLAA